MNASTAMTTTTAPRMIKGSEGNLDYMAVARNKNIVLGIKLNIITPGKKVGGPDGTLFIGIRIRAAQAGDMFDEDDAKLNVVAFGKDLEPHKAWDAITWEKGNSHYCSTQAGIYLKGTPETDPEMLDKALENKDLAKKITAAVVQMATPEKLIVHHRAIRDWLQGCLEKDFGKIKKTLVVLVEAHKEMEANIGVFGVQSEQMKKMHQKLNKAQFDGSDGSEVEDIDDNDENDDGDED